VAAASANTIFRVPSADSAVISSQRLGGNFAYSTHESPAYGVVSPVVSHVTSPVATTFTGYSVQQPASVVSNVLPQTYTVQQPASVVAHVQQPTTVNVVSTGTPAATTYTTGAIQQTVQNVGIPLTHQVAAAYNTWPLSYGSIVPTTYAAVQSNVVGVDAQKEVNQLNNVQVQEVQQVQQAQPQAVTYAVQQPQTWTVQQPQAATWAVQQPQATTYTIHNQHQGSVVATGSPVATTYAVQQPISVVASGTPASTYKTVAGASPLGFNTWGYGYGGVAQPWGYNVVA
jgi:hypothetical protein